VSEPSETVLLVDDEKNIRRTLRMVLEGEGYLVEEADSAAAAETALTRGKSIEVILLDVKLGEDNGIDFLSRLKSRSVEEAGGPRFDPDIPVIMISGHASIDDAVKATKLGAFDFLEKPLDRNRVVVTVRNAAERRRMLAQVSSLRAAVDSRWELLGRSSVMNDLRRQIAKVAPTRSRVLVTGRQISMYLCRELTELSLPKIGQQFGGRDHTTVMHADKKIRQLMAERRSVYNQVTELTNRIKSQARAS